MWGACAPRCARRPLVRDDDAQIPPPRAEQTWASPAVATSWSDGLPPRARGGRDGCWRVYPRGRTTPAHAGQPVRRPVRITSARGAAGVWWVGRHAGTGLLPRAWQMLSQSVRSCARAHPGARGVSPRQRTGGIVDDVAERVGGRREAVARSETIGGTSVHADTLSDDGHGRTGWPASCDAVTRTRVRAMRNGERVLSGTGDVRPAGPPAAPHIACGPPRVRGLSVRPMVLW